MLPYEIILIIFKRFTCYEIINCSCVSHLFHEMLMNNKLWYYLIKRDHYGQLYDYYVKLPNYHDDIEYYHMYKIFSCPYIKIFMCPHIDIGSAYELNSICKIDKYCNVYLSIPRNLEHDNHLSITGNIEYIFQHFNNLVWIDLRFVLETHNINIFCLTNMKLKYVNISHNKLRSLPSLICDLPELEELNMSRNYLSHLDNSFSKLS